jgi:phosphoglycerate-specific signal transduction histidine kinase
MPSHSASSDEGVSRKGILSRLGVRGRLLLAFFGISAFGVLGAGVAFYSFHRIDDVLALITQRRVPVALISQELSRHMERILAAAPDLLAATTSEQKAQWSNGGVERIIQKTDRDDMLREVRSVLAKCVERQRSAMRAEG